MAFSASNTMIKKEIDLDQYIAFLYNPHTKTMFSKFTAFLYRVLGNTHPNMAGYRCDF